MIRLAVIALMLVLPGRSDAARGRPFVPTRIVALNPLVAEWAAEILGDEYSAGRIVGVSDYSWWPELLKRIPSVGPYPRVDIERIAGLKPDLVLASAEYNRPDQIDRLQRLNLKLAVLPKERFADFGAWITELGRHLGEPERAARARARWEKALREATAVHSATNARRAGYFLEVQHEPLITAGGGSFITEALLSAGFKNVFAGLREGYPKVSTEAVIRADPDWIFILGHGQDEAELERSRKAWLRFGGLRAVRDKRIVRLSGEDFARCSLRLLNALKQLNSIHEP